MTLVDLTTLGWGTVQSRKGDALSGVAFSITDSDDVEVLAGQTNGDGQIEGTLASGRYTLTVGGETKDVDVSDGSAVAAVAVIRESPPQAKDHGCLCDGSTDDTAAATAALTSVNTLKFPDGTSILGDVALPAEGCTILGNGPNTVLKAKAGAANVLVNTGKRYQAIRDLVLDGNGRASSGLLTQGGGGATSQDLLLDRVRFYQCDNGFHITAGTPNQADKNLLIAPQFIECNIGVWNESPNGQEVILLNADFTSTYTSSIRMAGGSLAVIGGQIQGGTGTKGIEFTGSNVDWVSLQDFIFEGPTTDIDGGSFWPRDGVSALNTVFQGATANVLMGVSSSIFSAKHSRFNVTGVGVGNGKITSDAAGNHVFLEGVAYGYPDLDGTTPARLHDQSMYWSGAEQAIDEDFNVRQSTYRVRIGDSFALNGQHQASIYFDGGLDAGLARVQAHVLSLDSALQMTAIAAGSVPNDTVFKDSADGKLKFKDNGGTVNALY